MKIIDRRHIVGYSYPSSPNAVSLGFAGRGCWHVTKEQSTGLAIAGFLLKEDAEAEAARLNKAQS